METQIIDFCFECLGGEIVSGWFEYFVRSLPDQIRVQYYSYRQVDMLYWPKNRIIIIIDFVGRFDPPDEERGICVRTDWAELIVTTPKQITAPAMTRCLPRRNDGTGGWRPNELTLLRSGIKRTGCEIRVIY